MLKLEYILIGKLPETERDMLLENLRTERECGRNVLEWDSAKKHIQEGALAEKAILVSEDAKELSEAQSLLWIRKQFILWERYDIIHFSDIGA